MRVWALPGRCSRSSTRLCPWSRHESHHTHLYDIRYLRYSANFKPQPHDDRKKNVNLRQGSGRVFPLKTFIWMQSNSPRSPYMLISCWHNTQQGMGLTGTHAVKIMRETRRKKVVRLRFGNEAKLTLTRWAGYSGRMGNAYVQERSYRIHRAMKPNKWNANATDSWKPTKLEIRAQHGPWIVGWNKQIMNGNDSLHEL